jgi:hypothetical protein
MIFAPLKESYPDRIVLADCVLFLRAGTACSYTVGTPIEVEYTEQNGRRTVERIAPAKAGS